MTLSPTMQRALDKAVEHGSLVRWQGGFWTYPGCAVLRRDPQGAGCDVPTWYVAAGTVRALVTRGKLAVTEWKGTMEQEVRPI